MSEDDSQSVTLKEKCLWAVSLIMAALILAMLQIIFEPPPRIHAERAHHSTPLVSH